MRPRAWGPLCATLLLLAAGSARAFNVPKQTDYVTDTADVLTQGELKDLDDHLGDYERQSGNQIFVLVTKSLEGDNIDDVAYQVARVWKPGQKGKDNGVLLVIALDERRIRIETGKGVGGELTDLQSNDIIRQRIAPLMRQNRVHDAILAGVDGIEEALSGTATTPRSPGQGASGPVPVQQPPVALPHWFDLCFWGFILFVVVMLLLRASRHPRRRTYWGGPPFIGGGWGGGDWGGGGGGGGGGDGGSGFSGGGGGETGGGGSSDSY